MFFICSYCDRGQVYCSPGCRDTARRLQLRAANLRHQRSEEGRLDHRDRQRAYRRRLARTAHASTMESVTDHGSNPHPSYDTVCAAPRDGSEPTPNIAGLIQPMLLQGHFRINQPGIICSVCGRSGLFINPFYDLE
ncbi:MAG: hypothetical protein ACREA2_02585 [Blastocatellia bacterium]